MAAPLSGMTGFGRADRSGDFGRIEVEARSVNGKGLDVRLRLGPGLEAIEPALRDMIKARFSRGSVNVSVSYAAPEGAAGVVIDHDRLNAYAEAARRLSDAGLAAPATAGELLALKGVIGSEDAQALVEPETLAAAALEAAGEALGGLQAAREAEGAALAEVLEAWRALKAVGRVGKGLLWLCVAIGGAAAAIREVLGGGPWLNG